MEEHIEVQTQAQAAAAVSPAQDFDALLREKDFQSEFDRRVSRALEAARGRWAQETERKLEQAKGWAIDLIHQIETAKCFPAYAEEFHCRNICGLHETCEDFLSLVQDKY